MIAQPAPTLGLREAPPQGRVRSEPQEESLHRPTLPMMSYGVISWRRFQHLFECARHGVPSLGHLPAPRAQLTPSILKARIKLTVFALPALGAALLRHQAGATVGAVSVGVYSSLHDVDAVFTVYALAEQLKPHLSCRATCDCTVLTRPAPTDFLEHVLSCMHLPVLEGPA